MIVHVDYSPLSYELDRRTLNFCAKLEVPSPNPRQYSIWFGAQERADLLAKYGITGPRRTEGCYLDGIKHSFYNYCISLM